MGLKISKICNKLNNIRIQRNFEAMGENLLLVKLEFLPKCLSPYHWFLEDKRKPPFDIAINPDDGFISYIKFFFQDEKVQKNNSNIKYGKEEEGYPQFDTSSFDEKKYHIFEQGKLEAYIQEKSLYLIVSKTNSYRCLKLDAYNAILFDETDTFTGVICKDLSAKELGELVRAKILE
ncbi:hypothetical protein [Pelosinus sp. UFO1]|uniref:hypothetical protein n=1 Tax=Pelosinus sp. UFO1 TaxID=484770 RepID=UPI0004D1096D|nr:hypothetical protein [Pelosinus sp. UFO1]AIF51849.1 hypothetical protein UFO1_2302 [Pelosinus sp. UFO1]